MNTVQFQSFDFENEFIFILIILILFTDGKTIRHKEISEALESPKPLKTEDDMFETQSFSSWDVEEMKGYSAF